MKKLLSVLLAAILLLSVLCGCGASVNDSKSAGASEPEAYYTEDGESAPMEAPASGNGSTATSLTDVLTKTSSLTDKMIYTATASIESVEFDNSISHIYSMIERYGGFIESSYVSGEDYRASYYGYQTYRDASFTIRVPKENYSGMTDSLSEIGSVTSLSVNAENITPQFTDAEARLTAYKTEETRLLEMVSAAETVEELISVESRLSEVRYEIESITSTLRNWQNQVDYSTVTINLREVEKLSPKVEVHRSYWQQIGDGLSDTFISIGEFFKNLFKWLIVNLPVLAILAAAVCVVIVIVKRAVKRRRAKRLNQHGEDKES